jgi:hypothetical protein
VQHLQLTECLSGQIDQRWRRLMAKTSTGSCATLLDKAGRGYDNGISTRTLAFPHWATWLYIFDPSNYFQQAKGSTFQIDQFSHGFSSV